MANVNVTVRGKANYARILEDQLALNFGKDGKEWKLDVAITPATAKEMKDFGIEDRVKVGTKSNPDYLNRAPYMTFKQREFTKAGKKNDPITVTDITGAPWDQDKRIGNGSDVDVSFSIVDYGVGMNKGVYIRKVRVLNLIPFDPDNIKPIDEADPFYEKLAAAQAEAALKAQAESTSKDEGEDLNDDLPI